LSYRKLFSIFKNSIIYTPIYIGHRQKRTNDLGVAHVLTFTFLVLETSTRVKDFFFLSNRVKVSFSIISYVNMCDLLIANKSYAKKDIALNHIHGESKELLTRFGNCVSKFHQKRNE
jgi:hypothetical protein